MAEDKIDYKKFSEQVHLTIHSVRLLKGYQASEMDKKISAMVINTFSPFCDECKEVGDKIKNAPPKKSFINRVGSAMEEFGQK